MAWTLDRQTGEFISDSSEDTPTPPPEKSGMLRRTLGDAGTALAKGVLVGLPQAGVGLARLATAGVADPLLNPVSDQLNSMSQRFDKVYSPEHRAQQEEVANTKGFLPTIGAYLKHPGLLVDTVLEQLPSIAAGGAMGRAALGGKAALSAAGEGAAALGTKMGAVGEGLLTAGQNVEQIDQSMRDQGENSSLGQKLLGGLSGVVTGGISYGAGKVAAKAGITDADALFATGQAAKKGSLPGQIAKGALFEGVLEELPQSMQEQMWTNAALDRPLTEGVMEAGATGMVLGSVMGGGAQLANRPNPQAELHNQRVKDALGGISVLSQPLPKDANGAVVVPKEYDSAIRALTTYSRNVAGADAQAVAEWEQAARASLNSTGTLSFDGLPGVTSDAAARSWAQQRLTEMHRSMQGTPEGQDDFGNVIEEQLPRMLTKQQRAEYNMLQKALADGDMQTVARLQGKLYGPSVAQQEAAAPPAEDTPTAATEPAPPEYKKTDPRGWDDDRVNAEFAALKPGQTNKDALRREYYRRAEARQALGETDPMPEEPLLRAAMQAVMREDGKKFGTTTQLGKLIAGNVLEGSTVRQLIDYLSKYAQENAASPTQLAQHAGMLAQRLSQQIATTGVANEIANVNQGAKSGAAANQANAAVSGPAAQAPAAGAVTAQPTQKAASAPRGEVIPYDTVNWDAATSQAVRSSGQSDVVEMGGRKVVVRNVNGVMVPFYLSTGHGGKKDVAAGRWYPFFGIGSDGWFNKAGGQQMVSHYGSPELKAIAEELDRTIGDIRTDDTVPKASMTGTHVSFINQHMTPTANEQADTLAKFDANLKSVLDRIAQGRQSPAPNSQPTKESHDGQKAEVLTAGGEVVTEEKPPEDTPIPTSRPAKKTSKQTQAADRLALKTLEGMQLAEPMYSELSYAQLGAAEAVFGRHRAVLASLLGNANLSDEVRSKLQAAQADVADFIQSIKDQYQVRTAKVAESTKVLSEVPQVDVQRVLPPAEHWEAKRTELAAKAGVPVDQFYVPSYADLPAKVRTAWEKGDRKTADFKAAVQAVQGERAAERAKSVNATAYTFLSKSKEAYDRFVELLAVSKLMVKLERQTTHGTMTLVDAQGNKREYAHAEAVQFVLGRYNQLLKTASNKSAQVNTLAEMRERLDAEMAELLPARTIEDYRRMSAEQLNQEMTKYRRDTVRKMHEFFTKNPDGMSPQQRAQLNEKLELLKELGTVVGIRKGDWGIDDAAEVFSFLDSAAGSTTPALQAVLEATNGEKSVPQLLDAVVRLHPGALGQLATRLKGVDLSGVLVRYENKLMEGKHPSGMRAWKRGVFDPKTNTITIYQGGENAQTLLHEMVHAATVARLTNAKLADAPKGQLQVQMRAGYDQLAELHAAIAAMPEFAGEYANKNVFEFVAEAFSNPQLQAKLAATKVPAGVFGKNRGALGKLWDALVSAVRNMLGMPAATTDALSEAMRLAEPFFADNTGKEKATTAETFDALSSPVAALSVPFARAKSYTQQLDKWLAKTPWEDIKAKARRVWLGLVSSDYIKDLAARSPMLAGVKDSIDDWFTADRNKTQVKSLISKDVYDGHVRAVELALRATGDYAAYNKRMGELSGEASRLGFDLRKSFDQNNEGRGGKGQPAKLAPDLKTHINTLHQQFMSMKSDANPAVRQLADLITRGEKVNRKLFTMQFATLVRNVLDDHATSGKAKAMAQHLKNRFFDKLDLLQESGKLTNSDPSMHLDGLASHLHTQLEELFKEAQRPGGAHGDLWDDLKTLQRTYANAWTAPYMHLGRHGMNMVAFRVADTGPQTVAKLNELLGGKGFVFGPFAKESGEVFLRVESLQEMNDVRAILEANKGLLAKDEKGRHVLRSGALAEGGVDNMFGVSKALDELRTRMNQRFDSKLSAAPAGSRLREAYEDMRNMLTQEFLDMLEVNSARQVNQQRKGTLGYSADYLQNFSKRAQWADSSISNYYTMRQYSQAFSKMQAEINDLGYTHPDQQVMGQEMHDELAARFSNSLKPNTSPVAHALSVFGHNFYLALSPAYAIGNLLQPYMITLPLLGGRHGFVKSSKAMFAATRDATKLVSQALKQGFSEAGPRGLLDAKLDPAAAGMSADEVSFLQHLIRSGIVDATQSQELARMAKGESSTAATWAKTMSAFNHYTEVMNRLSAGLAAYRLQKAAGKGDSLSYAVDVVRRTQYDYAEHNKARLIGRHGVLGAATPLFMQFQTFAFFTMEHYLRMFKDGFIGNELSAGERAEARKALVGTLTTTAMVTGTMGLPFATVLAALANATGDDDKDARARYREWLDTVFGKDMAEIVAKGALSRGVLGVDMTGALGQQDLLPGSRWMADRRQWDDKVKDMSKSMLGPAINAGFDMYSGAEAVKNGDIMGGIKALLPRALKGPAEALRTANAGGFVNKAGQPLPIPVTDWDYLKMAGGFTPQTKAEQSEANFFYQSELGQRKQDKARVKQQMIRAQQDGDFGELSDLIQQFAAEHPGEVPPAIASTIRAQMRGRMAASLSGTGILESNQHHFPLLSGYTWANTGE